MTKESEKLVVILISINEDDTHVQQLCLVFLAVKCVNLNCNRMYRFNMFSPPLKMGKMSREESPKGIRIKGVTKVNDVSAR